MFTVKFTFFGLPGKIFSESFEARDIAEAYVEFLFLANDDVETATIEETN